MDNLLSKQTLCVTARIAKFQEECAVSGEFTLPEYCPDMTAMLKCVMHPRIQNRQQSGDQLLIDGESCVRVIYVDQERKGVRCVEFSVPFSCCIRGIDPDAGVMPFIHLSVKYVNCRVVTPRRLEVRGAVTVEVHTDQPVQTELAVPVTGEDVFCKCQEIAYTKVTGYTERVVTVNDSLIFPEGMPPAEMLLGGECRAVVRECKLLGGKAIVKGELYVHQLYTEDVTAGDTHSLDFALPFSQILDMDGVEENRRFSAQVLVLSDVERCGVGPEGNANLLEFSAKLLVRLQVYQPETASVLLDAYHTQFPLDTDCEELRVCEHKGMTFEQAVLPLQLELPERNLRELIDVWVVPQVTSVYCEGGLVHINGRLLISLLYRDGDGGVCFTEQAEEFHLEYACSCDEALAEVQVTQQRYRMVDNKLELQVGVWVGLEILSCAVQRAVCNACLHSDTPYPSQRATAMLYYAEPGDDVWEVGRRCHASPEKICLENGLTGDRIDRPSVLLVPMV